MRHQKLPSQATEAKADKRESRVYEQCPIHIPKKLYKSERGDSSEKDVPVNHDLTVAPLSRPLAERTHVR